MIFIIYCIGLSAVAVLVGAAGITLLYMNPRRGK